MKKALQSLLVCLTIGLAIVCGGCGEKKAFIGKFAPKNPEKIRIGVLQLATHEALNKARIGFIQTLEEAGYQNGQNMIITVKNPEGNPATLNQMATDLVRSNDLVLGIATDAVIALKSACKAEAMDIPVLFTAVTDAAEAGIVKSNAAPGANMTGTSDMNPINEQMDLIKELLPNISKMGILYTVSEVNSKVQADIAKAKARTLGIGVEVNTVSDTASIGLTVRALINKGVQAIYIPTDNLIAANMPAVVMVAEEMKIPVICGEESMVTHGGTITYGIDYTKLGQLTGTMALEIIHGALPGTMAVRTLATADLAIALNQANCNKINLMVPQSILDKIPSKEE